MRSDDYFAGLFDGEGSIGVYANNAKSRGGWSAKFGLDGTYRPMIEAAYQHFGVGNLRSAKRQAIRTCPKGSFDDSMCRQSWRWGIYRKSDVAYVLERITPFLFEKREQALIVLSFCRGELDGEVAAKRCREAKIFHYPANIGDESLTKLGSPAESNPMARLTYKEAELIRERVALGEKQINISRELGCSKSVISRIVLGKTYASPPRINYEKAV